ncbi:RNB-domain-containing protein [Sporormia fimetaria CBS 119925]|uniref:RNB-domain-containing protein n=1 Tax=Sporormia fimetaria CBS 119925 TaxID=1340428 RepID=A0A6A6VD69_9PLEO|nr:RNB-domain-containing protein [Sporormia fimetaria CBS 119925]
MPFRALSCGTCKRLLPARHLRTAGAALLHCNGDASSIRYRPIHTTQHRFRPEITSTSSLPEVVNPAILDPNRPIRDRLKLWQQELGGPNEEDLRAFQKHPLYRDSDVSNELSSNSRDGKSDEDLAADEQDDEDDILASDIVTLALFLKPGDVVEISRGSSEPVLAVVVQQINQWCQFLSVNGRPVSASLSNVSFAIPACIDSALITPLVDYFPTQADAPLSPSLVQIPRELSTPVIDILERLSNESEKIYRQNAAVLDTAYSTLADEKSTRMITLSQIAKVLLGRGDSTWTPSHSHLLAVRKALHYDNYRFRSDSRNHRLTNVFAVRPKHDVRVVETVHRWIREYDEHRVLASQTTANRFSKRTTSGAAAIAAFVSKARRVVTRSRSLRDSSMLYAGPDKNRLAQSDTAAGFESTTVESYGSDDQMIISFLQAWALSDQFAEMPALYSACTSLLHATGLYGSINRFTPGSGFTSAKMHSVVGFAFLQELGVLSPFDNRSFYDEQLMLPTIRTSRNWNILNAKVEALEKDPNFRDSMVNLRKDWGTMEVYCIDDADAKEIDDGISIAKVSGASDEYWIHVHIANPTAFFDKTHVITGLAAHMTQTVYFPDSTFSMLPRWVSQDFFGLRRDRPVLTISTRVNLAGTILERAIQPGIIRRVTSITPSQLSSIFGEAAKSTIQLIVGGDPPAKRHADGPQLSDNQRQDLTDLYNVAKALFSSRKAAGGLSLAIRRRSIGVFGAPKDQPLASMEWIKPSTDMARFISGDPVIQLKYEVSKDIVRDTVTARDIVEEMMILACSTAGAWCAERNIPLMYRGTVETPSSSFALDEFKVKILDPYLQKNDRLSRTMVTMYLQAMGRSIAHIHPLPHKVLGTQSYAKVTSPLRRFSDMVAHWQIEAALRYEAEMGRRFLLEEGASTQTQVLPFTAAQMQESLITFSAREKIINNANRDAAQHWSVLAFMRAHHYKEAKLPDTFKVWVRAIYKTDTKVALAAMTDYDAPVWLVNRDGLDMKAGDEWEASIISCDVFGRKIFMEPQRLLFREDMPV